jgi:hypothetical protein
MTTACLRDMIKLGQMFKQYEKLMQHYKVILKSRMEGIGRPFRSRKL